VFLHALGFVGHIMYSGVSGRETSTHYFSCLGGLKFDKMFVGSRYTELVFLHLVGYVDHEVQSSASGA
jgi:hypothetical protein